MMPEYRTVAGVNEIPEGQGKIFDFNGNQIAIWKYAGNFYAFQNVCPHRGGPVGEGELEGSIITCPWHGWQFDLTTCTNPMNPAAKLTKYDLLIEGDEIKIAL
jgi:nitrite reductase/ring-hydroxylating ferredoxin subunit